MVTNRPRQSSWWRAHLLLGAPIWTWIKILNNIYNINFMSTCQIGVIETFEIINNPLTSHRHWNEIWSRTYPRKVPSVFSWNHRGRQFLINSPDKKREFCFMQTCTCIDYELTGIVKECSDIADEPHCRTTCISCQCHHTDLAWRSTPPSRPLPLLVPPFGLKMRTRGGRIY